MNAKEHYVSQVLLRRFTVAGRLQSYNVKSDRWTLKPPKSVFCDFGYNQLLVGGRVDNTLEQAFSKVETHLPKTFNALEAAANKPSTELSATIYDNLCWYCAFLKRISPFAKAAAPVNFVAQINMELEKGRGNTLREVLNVPKNVIESFRKEYSAGRRLIIDSENFLQLVYRIQFQRGCQLDYSMFRHDAIWSICNSPIELPVADIALVPISISVQNATYFVLPIAPKLLLKGQINWGKQTNSSQTVVKGYDLTADEAETWLDAICLSAVTELVSSRAIHDILAVRERAKSKGFNFAKIVSPERAIGAGVKDIATNFGVKIVSLEEYREFVHSFIQPWVSTDSGSRTS